MNQTASVLMEIPAPTEIFWSIYGYHVNFIASSLSKTGIPHEWSLVLTHVSTFLVAFGIVAVIYMELQYQCWKFLYRLGWLERVQPALPEDRDYLTNYFAATSIATMPALYVALRWKTIYPKITYEFNIWQIAIFHMLVFLVQDVWYFYGHRFMHKNKFFWKYVHSHHHEKKNINAFSTGYAAWVENFLLISPPILLTYILMDLLPTFNMLTLRIAWFSQVTIFIVGHSGFKMNPLLYITNPFTLFQQTLAPVGLSQIPEDHEMHHLYPMCNFSLNFRLWDTMLGTYRSIESLKREKAN